MFLTRQQNLTFRNFDTRKPSMYRYYNLSLISIYPICFHKGYPFKCDNGKLNKAYACSPNCSLNTSSGAKNELL